MTSGEFLSRFETVKRQSDGSHMVRCPAHADKNPSLHVTKGRDGILLKCHAGCTTEAILDTLHLQLSDLFFDTPVTNGSSAHAGDRETVTATYPYRDPDTNALRYEIQRLESPGGKRFRVRRPDGHAKWIYQLDEADRLLYHAPEIAASDASEIVYLAEGEKCADALMGQGLLGTTSPFGAVKWRDQYADPLRGRHVVILPDHDAIGEAHAEQVARSLTGVAASVRVLRLPNLPEKGDVVDWFSTGGTREELQRLAQDAPGWTPPAEPLSPDPVITRRGNPSRQNGPRVLKGTPVPPDTDSPRLESLIDGYSCTFDSIGVDVTVRRIRESSDGIHAEVTVTRQGAVEPLSWSQLNLSSTQTRGALAKKLEAAYPTNVWGKRLEWLCHAIVTHFRTGIPAVELTPSDDPLRYAVDKVLVADEINEWYADGGNLKSYSALAVGLAVSQGVALPCGLVPRVRGPVLYHDAETNEATGRRRLGALMRGFGLTGSSGIHYRTPTRPLMDDVDGIRADIRRTGAALVVVDSFMMSIGGTNLIDAASPTMNALRDLPGTKLLLNHVAKSQADQRGRTRAIGTVTMMNGPRNAWELKRADEDDGPAITVGFFHTKTNDTRRHKPFALRWTFTETPAGVLTATIQTGDLIDAPDLAGRISARDRILQALKSGQHTNEELAEATDLPENQIRARLSALEKSEKVIRLPARDGKVVWGLPA